MDSTTNKVVVPWLGLAKVIVQALFGSLADVISVRKDLQLKLEELAERMAKHRYLMEIATNEFDKAKAETNLRHLMAQVSGVEALVTININKLFKERVKSSLLSIGGLLIGLPIPIARDVKAYKSHIARRSIRKGDDFERRVCKKLASWTTRSFRR